MKKFAFAAIAALVVTPVAAQEQKQYALDGGVSIALSAGWSHKQVQNPAMKMKSMREMMAGASDTRMKKGGTGILVSYMHFKPKETPPEMSEEVLAKGAELTRAAAAQYLRSSVETEVTPRSEIAGPLGVSLATLTARDGQKFYVAPGYEGGCVTTGNIRQGAATWAVSIASKSCESNSHKEAVEAFFAARAE